MADQLSDRIFRRVLDRAVDVTATFEIDLGGIPEGEYLQERYRNFRTQLEEEIRGACIELYRKNIYITARSVSEFLGKQSYLGRRDVWAIIVAIRRELGQTRK